MTNRIRAFAEWLGDVFWAVPALLALAGVLLAELTMVVEARWDHLVPPSLAFADDVPGARSLLGVIAGSAIGVAGTIFSITIAALSLTSGQMGPRLLRNFLRDRGNKIVLGLFLLTFTFCIELQRGMGGKGGSEVWQLGIVLAAALSLLCVGLLAWFVQHVASGINVETVVALVQAELVGTFARLTTTEPPREGIGLAEPPPGAAALRCTGTGYLRVVDYTALADWAARSGASLSVLARPGDYLHPRARVAEVLPEDLAEEAALVVRAAMTLGPRPAAAQDMEFAVRQLVEVAVRALSPGINDPFTAIGVLDLLGSALCGLAGRHLPPAVLLHQDEVVLFRRVTRYDGLCDAMFHMIRQAGASQASVLIRMVEVLGEALDIEQDPLRRAHLLRHVRLALAAGRDGIADAAGRADLDARARTLLDGAG